MVLTRRQEPLLINQFNHLNTDQPFQMAAVNYVLSPFEGNTNPGYPTGLKLYLQATIEKDKETDKLNISVFKNDIVENFPSLANKYG